MAEHEGYFSLLAFVGEPIPVEGTFATDDDFLAKRFDCNEEFIALVGFEVAVEVFFTVLIDHAGVHLVGVQVDSAVEWVAV